MDGDVEPQMLDRAARARLRTLSKSNSDHVARHLVMAGRLLDLDPERAYVHAKTAVASAGRVDVVREALALTAYATGRYAEALREIRTVRRLSGVDALPAIEADCERGLGRPERALDVLGEARGQDHPEAEVVEMAIVESGARADLQQSDAGLVVVENMAARVRDPESRRRLASVRADRLAELGRTAEAAELRSQRGGEPLSVVVTDLGDGEDAPPERPARPARPTENQNEAASSDPQPTADPPAGPAPAKTAASEPVDGAEPGREPESEPERDGESEREAEQEQERVAEPQPAPAPAPERVAEPEATPEPEQVQLDLFDAPQPELPLDDPEDADR